MQLIGVTELDRRHLLIPQPHDLLPLGVTGLEVGDLVQLVAQRLNLRCVPPSGVVRVEHQHERRIRSCAVERERKLPLRVLDVISPCEERRFVIDLQVDIEPNLLQLVLNHQCLVVLCGHVLSDDHHDRLAVIAGLFH